MRSLLVEEAEPIVSGAGCRGLLDYQLSALIKSLKRSGNGKCQKQSYQAEDGPSTVDSPAIPSGPSLSR
jgi:hypothetical protein